MDRNILIGGPQGGGIETASILAVRAIAAHGYMVLADREYHSNIKGKHSYSHIRFSERQVGSIKYPVDALGALDVESLVTHFHEVRKGGAVVHDLAIGKRALLKNPPMEPEKVEELRRFFGEQGVGETVDDLDAWLASRGVSVHRMPFAEAISNVLEGRSPLIEKVMNTALATALLGASGIGTDPIKSAAASVFGGKKEALEVNLRTIDVVGELIGGTMTGARAVADMGVWAGARAGAGAGIAAEPLERIAAGKGRLIVAGNDAVAIGKVLGGLGLQTYYPITPAADESFALEQSSSVIGIGGIQSAGPTVVQTEDEIAAVTMAIGGSLAGVRSATSTSGPGFSLMAEGLGWAGMNEVPVVVTVYQRGGPSTGLPTRNGQADLLFSIHAGHGEFPRAVLASGDHREAAEDAVKCMNIADEYQLPVIHLLDKALANCVTTMVPDFSPAVRRGKRHSPDGAPYRRFAFTEDGISPRAFLGEALQWYTGDEHDEAGHISESPPNRVRMQEKRMGKTAKLLSEIPDGDKARLFGPERYDDLILTWGMTTGACADALEEINRSGGRAAVLQVRLMEPFPADYVRGFAKGAGRLIGIECNHGGMLSDLVEARCGVRVGARALKDTGRMVSEDEVVSALRSIHEGNLRITLSGGE
jgi:2-oxoglutarate ferredoxin oxidoreductase subunit alpha